jgi:hypothetical protein
MTEGTKAKNQYILLEKADGSQYCIVLSALFLFPRDNALRQNTLKLVLLGVD